VKMAESSREKEARKQAKVTQTPAMAVPQYGVPQMGVPPGVGYQYPQYPTGYPQAVTPGAFVPPIAKPSFPTQPGATNPPAFNAYQTQPFDVTQHQQPATGAYAVPPQVQPYPGAAQHGLSTTVASQTNPNFDEWPRNCAVFVFRMPPTWQETDLITNFSYFGPIRNVKIIRDPITGQNKGYGFVNYESPECASQAIQSMNGVQIGTFKLSVSLKQEKGRVSHSPY